MNVVIIHGYFLRGTGSNLYVNNLAKTLCQLGHNVTIFCQESNMKDLDYICGYYKYDEENLKTHLILSNKANNNSKINRATLIQPNLGGELPVYVYDDYNGFNVKEFTDLEVEEIEAYISRNETALFNYLSNNKVDLIISNHTIMQPVYTERALDKIRQENPRVKHFVVIHGSALNFSVKNSNMLKRYALEALNKVDGCIFVSSYSKNEFMEYFFDQKGLYHKLYVIPAGVDTDNFYPLGELDNKKESIKKLKSFINKERNLTGRSLPGRSLLTGRSIKDQKQYLSKLVCEFTSKEEFAENILSIQKSYDNWAPDIDQDKKIDMIDWENDKVVLFFGKYLYTKGIQLIIASSPLVLSKYPETKFVFVGFGSSREVFESMVYALETNNRKLYESLLKDMGSKVGLTRPLFDELLILLENNDEFRENYYQTVQNNVFDKMIFTGLMDHHKLQKLIPVADLTVAPSVFPEAFGMVAVEALASGVLPVLTNHSSFKDIIEVYSNELRQSKVLERHNKKIAELKPLNLDENLVFNLSNNINLFLEIVNDLEIKEKTKLRQKAHEIAAQNYSWKQIAEKFVRL